jgi:hypothetical protein
MRDFNYWRDYNGAPPSDHRQLLDNRPDEGIGVSQLLIALGCVLFAAGLVCLLLLGMGR